MKLFRFQCLFTMDNVKDTKGQYANIDQHFAGERFELALIDSRIIVLNTILEAIKGQGLKITPLTASLTEVVYREVKEGNFVPPVIKNHHQWIGTEVPKEERQDNFTDDFKEESTSLAKLITFE